MTEEKMSVVELTADIVAAYVSANKVAADELPAVGGGFCRRGFGGLHGGVVGLRGK